MFNGELVQFGTPEEIFNRPKNPRVADFMGATNLLKGQLKSKSKLETAAGTLELAQEPMQAAGSSVTATIRPEHINLSLSASGPNHTKAVIQEAVYYGGIVSYNVLIGSLVLNVKDRSTRRFQVGEEVMLELDKEHLWVFPETESEFFKERK